LLIEDIHRKEKIDGGEEKGKKEEIERKEHINHRKRW
jgi:hypothetical protein